MIYELKCSAGKAINFSEEVRCVFAGFSFCCFTQGFPIMYKLSFIVSENFTGIGFCVFSVDGFMKLKRAHLLNESALCIKAEINNTYKSDLIKHNINNIFG